MKLLNIKKIAFVSALVAGSLVSVNVYAQTNLVTSFPTVLAGSASGTTLTGNGLNSGGLGAYSNSFGITAGHSYTLTYGLSGSIPNGGFSFTSAAASGGTRVVVAGNTGVGLITGTGNIIRISAATIAALAGGNAYLYAFGGSNASNIVLTINSLIDDGGASPVPSGPTAEEIAAAQAAVLRASTQQSVANTAQALQGTYALQNSVLANSFTYDCTLFDKNNICVSGGARNTAVQAANGLNNTSALVIAAYRPVASVRVGAYADQNLSVNNGGNTVNLSNNTPLLGLFAAWNQNQNDTGTEVRASIAYGQKNTTINRQVVGTSQAGSGSSNLTSQGAQITAKYGFGLADSFVVSPYVGMRYSQNNMGGYTEGASAGVTAPLTYGAVNTNATTALAGVGVSFKAIPKTNLFASAGVESDTNTANGTVNATSSTITGLTPVNFNANPVKTRPTATVGATYDVEKNQRVGVTGIYRQESYQAVSTTTVMATYTVGF